MFNGKNEKEEALAIKEIKDIANFDVEPCQLSHQFTDSTRYKRLDLTSGQKAQINNLIQYFVQGTTANTLANTYVLKFPHGLPHTLMKLNQGGFSSKIVDTKKTILGDASLYSLTSSAALLGAFTTMSAITGQYFLAEINNQMRIINMKLEEILSFLYGDKKAELLAEISFVQFAYENMAYIVKCSEQKIATLTNLQAARKVAEKDIEFYLEDLQASSQKEAKDIAECRKLLNHAMTIKTSIEYACQLYELSVLLEMYYSESYDEEYIKNVEKSLIAYTNRVERCIISSFSAIQEKIKALNMFNLFGRIEDQGKDKKELLSSIDESLKNYTNEKDSQIRTSFQKMIACLKQTEFFYDCNGQIYVKAAQGEGTL